MKEAEGSHNRERQRVGFLGLFQRGRAEKPSEGLELCFKDSRGRTGPLTGRRMAENK